MINALDTILADLIESRVPALGATGRVGFAPPNDDWRMAVTAGNVERLNVYLYDLRESLKLRSNDVTLEEVGLGWFKERRAPPLLDCHYLITAWSPATQTPAIEPSIDEHQLLGSVAEVLFRHRSIVVADVYAPGNTFPSGNSITSINPARLRTEELPIEVAQTDPTQELLEFWSSMKGIWRPSLKLKVSLPIYSLEPDFESPMVTTIRADHLQWHLPTAAEERFTFGGRILKAPNGTFVQGARVRLKGIAPPSVQIFDDFTFTEANGRFRFANLPGGTYHLTAVATGVGKQERDVDLPSVSGEYDMTIP